MEIRVEDQGKTKSGRLARVVITGAVTIYEAAGAKDRLLEVLRDAPELEVDLSGVEEVDTAGIQLLVMLKRESLATGKPLRLCAHSAATLDAMDAYNLASLFGDPVVLSSDAQSRRIRPAER